MSTSDSVAMRVWPMAWVPMKPGRRYWLATRAASPRSLISSSPWPMERISAPAVAVIPDPVAVGIFRRLHFLDDVGAQLLEPLADIGPALLHLVVNVEAL